MKTRLRSSSAPALESRGRCKDNEIATVKSNEERGLKEEKTKTAAAETFTMVAGLVYRRPTAAVCHLRSMSR